MQEKKANIEIVSQEIAPWIYRTPELFVTVKNSGNNTAYWVVIRVKAKDASGVIVDTGLITPGDYGDVKPGEQIRDSTILLNLDIDAQFTTEYEITWKER